MPIVSPDDQKVTFVELFFDLVFVFCVTQVARLLHGHLDLQSAGSAILVFWLVWWSWTQYTWALNAANTDHPRIQIVTLLATALAFLMGVSILGTFSGGAVWFAVPYVLVRIVGLLLYYWVAWADPLQRRAVRVFGTFSVVGLSAVMAGAILDGNALYWFWGAAILADLMAAGIGGQLDGWNLHPDHFAERHGLIVIIALGEALIVAAASLADGSRTPAAIGTAVIAVTVTCGLWWSYFREARPNFEHALAERTGSARSCIARDLFSIIHFPMLCGVVAMAAATEVALAHPDQPLASSTRLALGGGAALFVCGTAAALWRGGARIATARWILAPASALAVLVLGATPWVAMLMILTMLVAVGAVEHRSSIRHPGRYA
jgi:low temperature requirement protein LtrA